MKLSLVIPAKDINDPKLKELLRSIDAQDFPKDEMETLVITEGTSESAKAIGIRKAKGEVIGILASDNELVERHFLKSATDCVHIFGCSWPDTYYHSKDDNILNRYFSLIGGNDPLAYYMGKNDKRSYLAKVSSDHRDFPSLGDNGFFIEKNLILKSDMDNYYHIDNCFDIRKDLALHPFSGKIWHKTGGNIFSFFAKRYHYGLQHAFNKNRRWHLVDFSKPKDIMRLTWFIVATVTLIQPFSLSLRGYRKIKDVAWFLHPIVCLGTLFCYTTLMMHLGLRRLYQSLFALTGGLTA